MTPHVSIVVVCYGKREVTQRMLESLESTLGPALGRELELVLVDNASPDDTADLLRAWEDRATVLLLGENRNFSGGNNAGVAAASGEIVIFLNNDTIVRPGVLEALAEEVGDPTVGAAGPRLLYLDNTIQHAGVAWHRSRAGTVHPFHLFRHEPGDLPAAGGVYDLDVVTGACLAMRRQLFLELGGFDERYRNGLEDVDLCCRLRVAGYRVVYRGDQWLFHAEGATRGRNTDERTNEVIFHSRWDGALGDDTETVDRIFDASFNPRLASPFHLQVDPWGSAVSVEGNVAGLAPDSAEARAVLEGLRVAGLVPAARDWQQTWLIPKLSPDDHSFLEEAQAYPKRAGALTIHVPTSELLSLPEGEIDVLRLATPPARVVGSVTSIWAASAALARELEAAGFPGDAIDVLPSPVEPVQVGEGGGGLVCLLPAHDPAATSSVLAALATLGPMSLVLVPSVSSVDLVRRVEELVPWAELRGPVSGDNAFAAIAGSADSVLCADASDRFGRRALLAAGAGAAPILLHDSPALEVLDLETSALDSLGAALDEVAGGIAARAARARRVEATCSPSLIAPLLSDLVERAYARRSRILLAHAA